MTDRSERIAELGNALSEIEAALADLSKRRHYAVGDDMSDLEDDDQDSQDSNAGDDDENDYESLDGDDDRKEGRAPDLAKAYKFEAQVKHIAAERGIGLAAATTAARKEFPDLYAGYQEIEKRSLQSVADEWVERGDSPAVGLAKAFYSHPELAQSAINKSQGDTDTVRFMGKVDSIMKRDNCSRTAAMQTARRECPNTFAKLYQEV